MFKDIFLQLINQSPSPVLYVLALILLWVSSFTILYSVIYKFSEYTELKKERQVSKKHYIETFSMGFVILILFNLLQLNKGTIGVDFTTHMCFLVFGSVLAVLAVILHIQSKLAIGKYWSNQIEILEGHKIVTTGPYRIVRHPAYSSMILWLIGLSFMFVNYLVLLLTLTIFTPMMILRARAEDELLKKTDHTSFQIFSRDVNILIPRFNQTSSLVIKLTIIILFGYSLVLKEMNFMRVMFLMIAHLGAGFITESAKTRFAYRNKSVFLLIIYGLSMISERACLLYYLILLFNIWGLKFNCPCMFVYERYRSCPCFNWLKKITIHSNK